MQLILKNHENVIQFGSESGSPDHIDPPSTLLYREAGSVQPAHKFRIAIHFAEATACIMALTGTSHLKNAWMFCIVQCLCLVAINSNVLLTARTTKAEVKYDIQTCHVGIEVIKTSSKQYLLLRISCAFRGASDRPSWLSLWCSIWTSFGSSLCRGSKTDCNRLCQPQAAIHRPVCRYCNIGSWV